jgi:hypothetical protein
MHVFWSSNIYMFFLIEFATQTLIIDLYTLWTILIMIFYLYGLELFCYTKIIVDLKRIFYNYIYTLTSNN